MFTKPFGSPLHHAACTSSFSWPKLSFPKVMGSRSDKQNCLFFLWIILMLVFERVLYSLLCYVVKNDPELPIFLLSQSKRLYACEDQLCMELWGDTIPKRFWSSISICLPGLERWMAQPLRALSPLPEDSSSVPYIHTTIHNSICTPSSGLSGHQALMWYRHTCRQNTHKHKIKNNKDFAFPH